MTGAIENLGNGGQIAGARPATTDLDQKLHRTAACLGHRGCSVEGADAIDIKHDLGIGVFGEQPAQAMAAAFAANLVGQDEAIEAVLQHDRGLPNVRDRQRNGTAIHQVVRQFGRHRRLDVRGDQRAGCPQICKHGIAIVRPGGTIKAEQRELRRTITRIKPSGRNVGSGDGCTIGWIATVTAGDHFFGHVPHSVKITLVSRMTTLSL